jgi:hypothetical protein
MRTGGYDSSDAHKKDFRVWLKRRYENIEALNLSWANTSHESFDGIEHPTRINYDTATPSFFNIEDEMNRIDYHRFVNHAVLRFIAGLTSQIRAETDTAFEILAHAPGLLENTAPETGAWGRGALEAAGLDGTMTRLQSRHRQVGQHGYFASPTFQDTHTLSVDNTYTSIGYDTAAKSIKVPGTYIPDHVYNLMARNAILSAISGTTWVISDASGTGEFAHKPLWKKIDSILEIRHNILSTRTNDNTRLAVVLDGESPAYTQSPEIHRSIFDSLTDTLTHSGIAFTWLTLDSLLADPKPYAPVYLFPDLFQISSEKRERLHTLLAEQQATAIWLYAPGYIGETTDVANVTALTGITTKQREDGNSPLGSKFAFSGTWIEENQEFGSEKPTTLSFASTDELADPLARYQDDDSISIAMKHLEEGWTSIAIFEPHITHDLLRDIYYILEIPFDVSVLPATQDPVLYAGTDTLLLYSKTNSALSLELDNAQDVLNILDASQGWNNARTIPLELKAGTPALLSLR